MVYVVFTVASLTNNAAAISWFERPRAIRVSTSASRGVSSSGSGAGGSAEPPAVRLAP